VVFKLLAVLDGHCGAACARYTARELPSRISRWCSTLRHESIPQTIKQIEQLISTTLSNIDEEFCRLEVSERANEARRGEP